MSKIRIWGGDHQQFGDITDEEPIEKITVSIGHVPTEKEIRQLETALRKKWPQVRSVYIESRPPRKTNPSTLGLLISPYWLVVAYLAGCAKSFTQSALEAAGRKVGDDIGDKINAFVNAWLSRKPKKKNKAQKRATNTSQTLRKGN